ncbi:MAG TPA: glycoside hydrolase family 16 protein [Nocardioides sp.]|nr:glycoside hydrolase family 16 protein [Nocardioides sp.]
MRLVLASLLLMAAGLPAPDAADGLRADAHKVRVRMSLPQTVDADTARLRGRVTGRDTVVIQRYAAGRHRWIRVERLRAGSEGVFRATVRRTHRRERYRAVAGRAESPARVVPPANPTDGCGRRPVKGNGTFWSCTFVENFDGAELDRNLWRPQTGFPSGSDSGRPCYIDDPSVIAVRDGALHLSVRPVPEPIDCPGLKKEPTAHVAGMVSTYRLFSQQYGRFEARIRNTATEAPGLQEAFWLWPDDRYDSALWPAAGEIDIAETYSSHPELAIPFLHYTWNDNGGPRPGLNTAWDCTARRGVFNTFALEWNANRLEILVNGTSCLVNTSGDAAFRKRYIVALTQALGATGNEYDGRAPLPATMTVDYVKVWE